jgi:hypothetical protein
MPSFTIEEVVSSEPFQNEHGEFTSYFVRFTGDQGSGEAAHNRKAASPAPAVGEVIDGEIVVKNGKPTLKRSYNPGARGAGGGMSRSEDPKRSAEIRRMACQRAAIELLTAEVAAGLTFEKEKASELLLPRIQWLEDDVRKAGERAS